MVERPTLKDFAPLVETQFQVGGMDGCELELASAKDLSNAQLEQFSLVFTGGFQPWLRQGSYLLSHPQMGECVLFLVPVGPVGAAMRYEAVFSRFQGS